jgi:hypothetical protein
MHVLFTGAPMKQARVPNGLPLIDLEACRHANRGATDALSDICKSPQEFIPDLPYTPDPFLSPWSQLPKEETLVSVRFEIAALFNIKPAMHKCAACAAAG